MLENGSHLQVIFDSAVTSHQTFPCCSFASLVSPHFTCRIYDPKNRMTHTQKPLFTHLISTFALSMHGSVVQTFTVLSICKSTGVRRSERAHLCGSVYSYMAWQILSVIVLTSESLRVCAHDATDSLYLSGC